MLTTSFSNNSSKARLSETHVVDIYSRRLVAAVLGFGLLTVLAVAGVLGLAMLNARTKALENANHSTRSLALAVTDSVARAMQSVDLLLQSASRRVAESPGGPRADLDRQLRELLVQMPHVRQLAVLTEDGRIVGDSSGGGGRIDPVPFFQSLQQTPRPMVVGASMPGRFLSAQSTSAHRYIPFFRSVKDGAGQDGLVVVAVVNPLYFRDIFQRLEIADGGSVRMWRYDGTLLESSEAGNQDLSAGAYADRELFDKHLRNSEIGGFLAVDDDGVERITNYRMTLNWPVVVTVGVSVDDVLEGWRRDVREFGLPAAAAGAVLLVLTVFLTRTLLRRARAEEGLRLSERVLDTMSNGVAIADARQPDHPLIYVNPAFEQITGYSADQALGRNARFLHRDDRAQPGLDVIRSALARGGAGNAVVKNYRQDGVVYWNDLTVTGVRDKSGRLTHFVAVQRDITEQQESRASLDRAYTQIERYSAELERFSYILAHHLQEPARHVIVYSQMIGRELAGVEAPEMQSHLGFLMRAGARLQDLLRDVQLYLAMDRLVMAGGSADSDTVLDRQWVARTADVKDCDLIAMDLPRVRVPAKRLGDLFGILIDNSVTFRHPDRPLTVSIHAEQAEDGFVKFVYKDNGIGINPEFIERIFGVFERLHNREKYPGNGIGLAIARKLVEALGGYISARSDGETGSEFIFTLPAAEE